MSGKLTEYEDDILSTIDKHGWHGTFVFDPKGTDPNFTYSTGFSKTLNAPEFIIFGLSNEIMHSMLWGVYEQIEKGTVPEDGMAWQGLLGGDFVCVSRKVIRDDTHELYSRSADWFWKHSGHDGHPEVFQMVWPGAQQGLLPWEKGCSQQTIDMQTPLWTTE